MSSLSIKRLAALLALNAYALGIGVWLGRLYPPAHFMARTDSPLIRGHATLIWRLNEAASALMNCTYFKRTHTSAWDRLFKRTRKPFYFGYDSTAKPTYYAGVKALSDTIWLTREFFGQPPAEQVRTLAHEMLHIVRLPPHSGDCLVSQDSGDCRSDAVYLTTDACFPALAKEAVRW